MHIDPKNVLKSALYTVRRPTLRQGPWALGYIFHTERPHETQTWDQLIEFCTQYEAVTGARPLCALISPANPYLWSHTQRLGHDFMREQFERLSQVASLGYHGHYWYKGVCDPFHGMRYAQFHVPSFLEQIERDLHWFEQHDIELNSFYAAGWWTMNPAILEELVKRGFTVDYSFSHSPWFRNMFSYDLLTRRAISAARPFRLQTESGQIGCIQNLIGCHSTPYTEDFVRNLNALPLATTGDLVGVVNAHDYDLRFDYTLRAIKELAKQEHVSFLSHDQLESRYADTAAVIPLNA